MTDDRLDPRFDAALRATLAELEPGAVPASVRNAVAAVPIAKPRHRSTLREFLAFGVVGAAGTVLVTVVAPVPVSAVSTAG